MLGEGIPEKRILSVIGSMEDPKTAERIVEETVKKFGQIDVLVRRWRDKSCGISRVEGE